MTSAQPRMSPGGATGLSAVRQVIAAVRIVRPLTCIMAGISPACGIVLSGGLPGTAATSVALVMLAMACVMGVANTVNDIVDLPADRVEKAARPLPSGRLGVAQAWTVAGVLAAVAVVASTAIDRRTAGATCALLTLSVLYSYRLKNTVLIGNVAVGVVCAATLLTGAGIGGHPTGPVWVATSTIFLFMLAYEILKTLQDREADTGAGLRTLATVHGPSTSLWAYALTAGSLSLVALGGALVSRHPSLYVLAVLVCLVGPVWAGLVLLTGEGVATEPIARCLTVLRLAWLPGLTSLLLLG